MAAKRRRREGLGGRPDRGATGTGHRPQETLRHRLRAERSARLRQAACEGRGNQRRLGPAPRRSGRGGAGARCRQWGAAHLHSAGPAAPQPPWRSLPPPPATQRGGTGRSGWGGGLGVQAERALRGASLALTVGQEGSGGARRGQAAPVVISALLVFVQQVSRSAGSLSGRCNDRGKWVPWRMRSWGLPWRRRRWGAASSTPGLCLPRRLPWRPAPKRRPRR